MGLEDLERALDNRRCLAVRTSESLKQAVPGRAGAGPASLAAAIFSLEATVAIAATIAISKLDRIAVMLEER